MKIKIFLYAFAAVFLACCSKGSTGPTLKKGEVEVEMKLLEELHTKAYIAAEGTIHTVDLLVFERSGSDENDAIFIYSRYAWLKSGSTYCAVLKEGSNLNIYFAINARDMLDQITEGMTYGAVREKLMMTDPDRINLTDKGLPMWGMVLNRTVTSAAAVNNMGTVKLLRSVASTDIGVIASNFTLAKGHIVYGADKGYLPYSSGNVSPPDPSGDFRVISPEVPGGMAADKEWSSAPTAAGEIDNVFYMFGNDADGTGTKRQTKVILEGKWSGSPQPENTFYPLAFRDPGTGDKLKVKRNSKYIFIVTNVNGDGYDTLDEAKEAEDANMDYEVIEWNQYEDGDIHIDGTRYFSISSKKAVLASQVGATAELVFATNYELSSILMKYNEGDTGIKDVIDTHNRFKVEVLTKSDVQGNPYTCFEITTKESYGTNDNPAVLIVTVGRIKFSIVMEQVQVNWESGGDQNVDVTYPL